MKCFKCGTEKGKIIKHHVNYSPEIIVDCCWSCHQKIHRKLRKNKLCPLSVENVHKISKKSSGIRNANKYYINKLKTAKKNYNNILKYLDLSEKIAPNIQLFERIRYNLITGNLNYQSYFHSNSKQKLKYIDIFDEKLQLSFDNRGCGGSPASSPLKG